MKNRTVIAYILSALCIIELSFIGYASLNRKTDEVGRLPNGIDIAKTRKELVRMMQSLGYEAAYAEFKSVYTPDTGNQHSVSHIFGELLYDKKGIDGLVVCDDTFAYGCYHGFFGRAISRQGKTIIPKLNAACLKKKTNDIGGCQHGIGHGILTYLGDDRIMEALELCRTVSLEGSIRGCLSGIFMEYNLHTMDDPSGRTFRHFDMEHPNDPCDRISDDLRVACYYELPQWWEKVYAKNYQTIAKQCDAVDNPMYRAVCFRGIGNIVKFATDYDVTGAVALCAHSTSADGELLCRTEAYKSFSAGNSAVKLKNEQFCAGLAEDLYTKCLSMTAGAL